MMYKKMRKELGPVFNHETWAITMSTGVNKVGLTFVFLERHLWPMPAP